MNHLYSKTSITFVFFSCRISNIKFYQTVVKLVQDFIKRFLVKLNKSLENLSTNKLAKKTEIKNTSN